MFSTNFSVGDIGTYGKIDSTGKETARELAHQ